MRALTALILAVASIGTAVRAQTGLSLNIEFDRSEWIAGEPVVAYVGVRNTGAQSVEVRFAPGPEFGRCRYIIAREGVRRIFLPWALKDARIQAIPLPPADLLARPVKLFVGSEGYAFATPGDYSVQVTCAGIPNAAVTTVRVLAPRTADEATQSRSVLDDPNVGYFFLFEGGDHLTTAISVLRALATSPGVFQPYARVALGLSAAREFVSPVTGVRPADPAAARALFASPPDTDLSAYYLLARKLALLQLAFADADPAQVQRLRQEIATELVRETRSTVVRQALRHTFDR